MGGGNLRLWINESWQITCRMKYAMNLNHITNNAIEDEVFGKVLDEHIPEVRDRWWRVIVWTSGICGARKALARLVNAFEEPIDQVLTLAAQIARLSNDVATSRDRPNYPAIHVTASAARWALASRRMSSNSSWVISVMSP